MFIITCLQFLFVYCVVTSASSLSWSCCCTYEWENEMFWPSWECMGIFWAAGKDEWKANPMKENCLVVCEATPLLPHSCTHRDPGVLALPRPACLVPRQPGIYPDIPAYCMGARGMLSLLTYLCSHCTRRRTRTHITLLLSLRTRAQALIFPQLHLPT